MRKFHICFTLLVFSVFSSNAQLVDSVSVAAQAYLGLTTGPEQALLINSDKWGLLRDDQQNLVAGGEFYAEKELFEKIKIKTVLQPTLRNSSPYETGDEEFGAWLNQYYADFSLGKAFLRVGASDYQFTNLQGDLNPGSFINSANARPIPSIVAGFSDFVDVPFTRGYMEIKGEIQHGWMEDDRYVQKPFLHGKSAYAKIGGDLPVNLGGGIVHRAIWAGTDRSNGSNYDDTFDDFLRVFFGGQGTRGQTNTVAGGDFYGLGSNFGSLDVFLDVELKDFSFSLYHIKPWEDTQQFGFSKFWVKYFRNIDYFNGVNVTTPWPFLRRIHFEYAQTKWQFGPGTSDPPGGVEVSDDPDGCIYNYCYNYGGRENYYNNFLYSNGWTHYGRVVGTPLFFTQSRLLNFDSRDDFGSIYRRNFIYNNRMRSFTLGVEGDVLKSKLGYRARFALTENFGNFYAQYGSSWQRFGEPFYFDQGVWVFYSHIATSYRISEKTTLNFEVAADFGDIFNTSSFLIAIDYNLFSKRFK